MASTSGVDTAASEERDGSNLMTGHDEKVVWVPGLPDFDIADEKDYIGSVAFTVDGMPVQIARKNGGRPSAPLVFVMRYNCKTGKTHPVPPRMRSRYPLKSLRRAITKEAALRALADLESDIADLSQQVEQLSLLEGRLKSHIDQAEALAENDSVEIPEDNSDASVSDSDSSEEEDDSDAETIRSAVPQGVKCTIQ